MENSSEKINEIIREVQTGKESAKKFLYEKFFRYGCFICYKYVSQNDEVEIIVNDSFVKVFANIDKFDFKYPFQSWLKRIVINTSIDFLRKNKQIVYSLNEEIGVKTDDAGAVESLSANDILEAIKSLPESYRLVFNLFAIENYKHEEIANMLGITVGTSKSNLFKARQKLKQILTEELGYER